MSLPPVNPPKSVPEREIIKENEIEFILDATLSTRNRKDPSVIAFINNFIRCRHVGQASVESGIAPSLGYQIRHRNDVATAIQKITDKAIIKHGFDASEIIERTKETVDFDPVVLMNPDGSFKDNLLDIPPEARRNIKKMKVKNLYSKETDMNGMSQQIIVGKVIEFEFYDKLKAAEMLGKEKELFKNTTRVEHDVTKNMAAFLLASAKLGDTASLEYNNKDIIDVTPERQDDE